MPTPGFIKYNIFSASNLWNALKTINNTALNFLKKLWNREDEGILSKASLFIPRVLGSAAIGAAYLGASTITAGIGAITAGIIGGTAQTIWGTTKVLAGGLGSIVALTLDNPDFFDKTKKLFLSGTTDLFKGISKVIVGSVVAGSIALGVASGVGAPATASAIAAVSSISIAGHSLGFLTAITPIITPIVSTANSFLVSAGLAIASIGKVAIGAIMANQIIAGGIYAGAGIAVGAAGLAVADKIGFFGKLKSFFSTKKDIDGKLVKSSNAPNPPAVASPSSGNTSPTTEPELIKKLATIEKVHFAAPPESAATTPDAANSSAGTPTPAPHIYDGSKKPVKPILKHPKK